MTDTTLNQEFLAWGQRFAKLLTMDGVVPECIDMHECLADGIMLVAKMTKTDQYQAIDSEAQLARALKGFDRYRATLWDVVDPRTMRLVNRLDEEFSDLITQVEKSNEPRNP